MRRPKCSGGSAIRNGHPRATGALRARASIPKRRAFLTRQLRQTVAAMPIHGCYAQFVCVPARKLVPVPAGLDPAEAVAVVLNYITAQQMLHRSAKARPGQSMLIHGASGGVGSAADLRPLCSYWFLLHYPWLITTVLVQVKSCGAGKPSGVLARAVE